MCTREIIMMTTYIKWPDTVFTTRYQPINHSISRIQAQKVSQGVRGMLPFSYVPPQRPLLYTPGSQFGTVVGKWQILSERGTRRVFCIVGGMSLKGNIGSCPFLFLFCSLVMGGAVLLYDTLLPQYTAYLSLISISGTKHWPKELVVE